MLHISGLGCWAVLGPAWGRGQGQGQGERVHESLFSSLVLTPPPPPKGPKGPLRSRLRSGCANLDIFDVLASSILVDFEGEGRLPGSEAGNRND